MFIRRKTKVFKNSVNFFSKYIQSLFFPEPSFIHVILLNRPLRVVIVMFLAMIVIPPLVYVFFFSKEALPAGDTTLTIGTCAHSPIFQVPCGRPDQSESTCSNNRCCFSSLTGCYHSLPAKHQFSPADTWTPASVLEPLQATNPFGGINFPSMRLAVRSLTDTRLQIEFWNPLKFQGVDEEIKLATAEYTYKIFKYSLIEAYRAENNNLLFSTSRGPFMASDNYLEWNMFLGSHILFGLGQKQLERGDKFILMNNQNGSSIPYITAFNNVTDEFHGILFNAPSPVEITMLESDLLMLRTFYTDNLKIDILTGPTPLELLKQLQGINDFYIPPFWAHGIHICREDPTQDIVAAIEDINDILSGPTIFDSHCLLEDLFWLSNSTDPISEEITKVITDLKVGGKKFVASINSLVLSNTPVYLMAETYNLLMKTATKDETYLGKYNSSDVAYINWADSSQSLDILFNSIWPTSIQLPADGFILQNNWMRDITEGISKISPDLPYLPENINESMDITTPWNITLPDTGSEILQIHNQMGPLQTSRTSKSLLETEFLASSSYEIGTQSGGYIRNISSTWSGFRSMVNRTISSAVSGINFFGAPVCGDIEVTSLNEELCIRWYQFSSMTPFFRVITDRIPIRFSNYAQNIMNSIIRRRYTLLSYFNSLMIEGHPVIAPMYFHFYKMANNSQDYDEQFLVGEGLLFAPILLPTATLVSFFRN